jgi:hypothetical protein
MDEAKVLVVIGYSYADDYVNIILSQALSSKTELRVLNIAPFGEKTEEELKAEITKRLNLKNQRQLICFNSTAKDFIVNQMNKEFFQSNVGEPEGAPFN